MQAGKLRHLVAFEAASREDDGGGGTVGTFVEVFRCAASIDFLKSGSETVIGQRLQGVQPVIVGVRDCVAARAVGTTYRVRDIRTGQTFNIRSVTPNARRTGIDFLCDTGRADGDESNRP